LFGIFISLLSSRSAPFSRFATVQVQTQQKIESGGGRCSHYQFSTYSKFTLAGKILAVPSFHHTPGKETAKLRAIKIRTAYARDEVFIAQRFYNQQ